MVRTNMRRRTLLKGMGMVAASALLPMSLLAQEQSGGSGRSRPTRQRPIPPDIRTGRRIDVHHHYAPPGWIKTLGDAGALNVESWKGWHYSQAVEAMDRAGVAISFSSITVPGIYFAEGFGNQQAPRGAKLNNDVKALAREANEFGARMKSDFPGRFGIWASLPLPDIGASLSEIEYALDTLKLDGIGLATSIGSRYLGDKSFAPVFDELNRRGAIIYTHPQTGPCCLYAIPGVAPTTLEYSHDTARTIVSWVESGSAARLPKVRWIYSHGGGSIWGSRFLQREIGTSPKALAAADADNSERRRLAFLRQSYFDTAATTNFAQIQTLKTLVGSSQIVFGADHPYVEPLEIALDLREMQDNGVLTATDAQNIDRENMIRWIPSLKE